MTSEIEPVPKEIVALIPQYKGDKRQLNLYLPKCEYVIERYSNPGREEQNLCVYNVLSSKLTENATALLSEREDVVTWCALKELLIQHFGDPRSEKCINIE
ncbi:Cytadhesion [Operophtera brumata]|uniref:Cytadhesion n=1 Tax=Operophtera brumata TaxID=104452 RepID=A0A0L7LEJ0_OPEBR|nr:Cytadhesion [Operophtera brumata]